MISKGDLLSINPPYPRSSPNSSSSIYEANMTVTFCMSILENENITPASYNKENVKMTTCIDAEIKDLQNYLVSTSNNGDLAVLRYDPNKNIGEVIIHKNKNITGKDTQENWSLEQYEFGVI